MGREFLLASAVVAAPLIWLGIEYPQERDALIELLGAATYEKLPTLTTFEKFSLIVGTVGVLTAWLAIASARRQRRRDAAAEEKRQSQFTSQDTGDDHGAPW